MANLNDTLINTEIATKEVVSEGVVSNTDTVEEKNEVKSSVEVLPSQVISHENLEFTRANIELLGSFIHLVDSDEDNKLDMFCYVKCDETDSDFLKQCRGVVFNGHNIVMKAFPYTTEFSHVDFDKINNYIGDFSKWTFYESHEGALVRLFNFNGKWFVSTHRKLNAFRSKWASRESFGTSFKMALSSEEENNPKFKDSLPAGDNILERFQGTLNTDHQYMFLIRNNTDNRIVSEAPPRPTVYHVGTFVDGKLVLTEDVNIPYPKKMSFLNVDELKDYVGKINYKDLQGVIGFTDDNKQLKIVHDDYRELFRVRGNEPSIKFRYLQVRMNRRYMNMLYHLYPNMHIVFDEYENTLYDIARSIYRAYVQRFIKKRYVTVPREEFAIIRECHSWHLSNRAENRISLSQIIKVMNQNSPTNLNHMIRRFKLEQTRQKEQQTNSRPRSDSVRSNKSYEKSPAVRTITAHNVSPMMLSQNSKIRRPPPQLNRTRVASIHKKGDATHVDITD